MRFSLKFEQYMVAYIFHYKCFPYHLPLEVIFTWRSSLIDTSLIFYCLSELKPLLQLILLFAVVKICFARKAR